MRPNGLVGGLVASVALVVATGCAPRIVDFSPKEVAYDDEVTIYGESLDEVNLAIAGVPCHRSVIVPSSRPDAPQMFTFYMPFSDGAGNPIMAGTVPLSVRRGGIEYPVNLTLTERGVSAPAPQLSVVNSVVLAGRPSLLVYGERLRRPIMVRLTPVNPGGAIIDLRDAELTFELNKPSDFYVPLPQTVQPGHSFKLKVQNGPRYGARWSDEVHADYKPM